MYIQPDEPIHHNVVVYAHKEGKKFEWHHILGVVLGFIGFIAIIILLIKRCLSRRRYRATGKVIRRNRKRKAKRKSMPGFTDRAPSLHDSKQHLSGAIQCFAAKL
nr:unnamed protein product [Callosobruchus chinensis]